MGDGSVVVVAPPDAVLDFLSDTRLDELSGPPKDLTTMRAR